MILLNLNVGWYARLKSYFRQKYPVQTKKLEEFWNSHSGDWHWLQEKPIPVASLNRSLWRASVPSVSFYFLLGSSGIIATLGLLANNVAIIIGAMIIAPLIGPIIGIAYATTVANRRLLRRSFLTLITGVLFTIFISFVMAIVVGLRSETPEILARTNPTLIDLVIALAAGAAGSFANTRRRIADALPGVAIAVALVPPLSVIGIGFAMRNGSLSFGAAVLFATNLTGIIFSGVIILLLQSYGSVRRAKHALIFSMTMLIILGLPLGWSLKSLIVQNNVRHTVRHIVHQQVSTTLNSEIRSVEVNFQQNSISVDMEVVSTPNTMNRDRLTAVKKQLTNKLERPVNLNVKVLPLEIISIPDDSTMSNEQ